MNKTKGAGIILITKVKTKRKDTGEDFLIRGYGSRAVVLTLYPERTKLWDNTNLESFVKYRDLIFKAAEFASKKGLKKAALYPWRSLVVNVDEKTKKVDGIEVVIRYGLYRLGQRVKNPKNSPLFKGKAITVFNL